MEQEEKTAMFMGTSNCGLTQEGYKIKKIQKEKREEEERKNENIRRHVSYVLRGDANLGRVRSDVLGSFGAYCCATWHKRSL
mmetsp:Transcript_13643/g.21916  ORF Transcript_13643/g.21916 Transcript_13643/m.21916 type:complete len:82 (-) Transcript_13643:422-667(-)